MSKRKLRDITPPGKSSVFLEEKRPKIESGKTARIRFFKNKKVLAFFVGCLFILAVFLYFSLPRAEIEIWPETDNFYLEESLFLDQSKTYILNKEKSLIDTFKSSAQVLREEKAEGQITVYNEYSTSPQVLIETTRFVSSDGKVFRTPTRVTVPGGTEQGGKIVPGEITITVVAEEPGPEYNIGPTTFSIPGFAGTPMYTKFYAKSSEPMTGGFIKEAAKVAESDLRQAEESLTKRVEQGCQELIKEELMVQEKYYYNLEGIKVDILEKFSSIEPGEEVEEFTFQIKAECRALVFEKEYLKGHVRELILGQISEGDNFVEESLSIGYSYEEFDMDSGEIDISLTISTKTYSEIDLEKLRNALIGKTLVETELILANQPEIEKANILFWPFWVKKSPQNPNKIDLSLRFD